MKNTYINKNKTETDNIVQVPNNLKASIKLERIAKRIARSGLCSRREAERWIIDGKVRLNNKILTECGTNVTKTDLIEVNGKSLPDKIKTKLDFA